MTKKRINSPETKNEEYDLAMQLMTIPRFCGLLQSDGHFSVIYDKEKVQNPRIILTQSNKRSDWLCGVQDWLNTLDIQSSMPTDADKLDSSKPQRGINLTIDRANCRKLISLIEEKEMSTKTPLLFDSKRVRFLLLKESIRIKLTSKPLTKEQAAMLVDIKESGLKQKPAIKSQQVLTRDQLIERLGFSGIETEGCADNLIQTIHQEVETCGAEVLETLLKDPKQINPALAEFIAGVFDGDGSITVGLFTHLSESGGKLPDRHTFSIVPAINVTTQREDKARLLNIINAAFGKGEQMTIENPNPGGNGIRLVIKSTEVLKKNAVPFFEKYPLSLKKNVIRFQTFRTVLGELPLNYQNKERVKEIIREIYDKDLYERDKPLEVFLDIVERDYH